jgi:transcriptional antiterminator RfaH
MERNIEYLSLHWYAVHTKPRQEERAEHNLRTLNGGTLKVETFSPKVREDRFDPVIKQMVHVVKPLFPNYIFARFDAGTMLHKVWFTRGVNNVVNFGHKPAIVPDEIITLIQLQMGTDGYVKIGEEIALGDKVRIKGGPLNNFVGVFERNGSAAKRIKLLLSAVSYQCRIEIDRNLIEKVS